MLSQHSQYRIRYARMLKNIKQISKMKPKQRYMYSFMDSVIFQDFETALDVVLEDYKNASNDNISA